jgi:3-oxoacyl-[acyl-carrier protein] reductase
LALTSSSQKRKVAIVTGGSGAIGRSTARALTEIGALVVMIDIVKASIDGDSNYADEQVVPFVADVSKFDQVHRVVDEVVQKFGRIDILVNNAGILRRGPIDNISEEEWDRVIDVNLKSAFNCCKAVVPFMKKRRYGRIVNISSSAGRSVSTLGGVHYTASKAGMLGLTRHLARELAPHNITVNAVCPGTIDTPMTRNSTNKDELELITQSIPIGRIGRVDDVSRAILFLISDGSSFITGVSLDINGGELLL